MAGTDLQIVVRAIDEASSTLRRVGSEVNTLSGRVEAGSLSFGKLTGATFAGNLAAQAFTTVLGTLTSAATSAFGELTALQNTRQSFEVLTGSAQKASAVMADLSKYAMQTPFEFNQIASATKTLLGFGSTAEGVGRQIRQLGDIAGATGGDINAIAIVFGQVQAQGKMMTQDFYQLINQGVALGDVLAKKLGVPASQLKDELEKGHVTFKIFSAAVDEATSATGKFYRGADKLSQTLTGRLSTLKDNFTALIGSLVGVDFSTGVVQAGGAFDRLSQAVLAANNWISQNQDLISGVGKVVGGTLLTVVDKVGQGFRFISTVITSALTYFRPVIDDIVKQFNTSLLPSLERAKPLLEDLARVIGITLFVAVGVLLTAMDLLERALAAVADTGMAIRKTLLDTFSSVSNGATNLWNQLVAGLEWLKGHWVEAFGYILGFMATLPIKIVGYVVAGIYEINKMAYSINWGKVAEDAGKMFVAGWVAELNALKNIFIDFPNWLAHLNWGAITKGIANGVISFVEGALNGALSGVPGMPHIKIPRFEQGVQNFSGGLAIVGEKGPELVTLPRGANVLPAPQTAQALKGSGGINVTQHIYNNVDMEAAMRDLGWRLSHA